MSPSPADHRIEPEELEHYLKQRVGASAQIRELCQLRGEAKGAAALKQFGYGRPLLVRYGVDGREVWEVFHRIRRNAFGRERADDRAAAVWLDFQTFNHLPRHVPAVDMLVQTGDGKIASIHAAEELLLVTRYRPGHLYAEDLVRIRDEGTLKPLDVQRAETLAAYLAQIHERKHDDPTLWRRRLRDLVGHGEGIMGLTDGYPADPAYVTEADLRWIEEAANRWRWRLKPLSQRLRQVHGDFHPFNLLFEQGLEFHVLDRSRGAWGEPADDVSCLTINYLFFSLQRSGCLEGAFRVLHDRFWERYLALRPDDELPAVIQPWFAWRALVLASPVWYPTIAEELRHTLLTFARRVLGEERYDYRQVNQYLELA
jgi:aminoglycoside phosphotransferase (APT) family kinase protein